MRNAFISTRGTWIEIIFLSDDQGKSSKTIPYDYLVYAVGAEVQTFGTPGVQEKACFMKEIQDAEKVSSSHSSICLRCSWIYQDAKKSYGMYAGFFANLWMLLLKYSSGIETAAFPGQPPEEVERLLHMVLLFHEVSVYFSNCRSFSRSLSVVVPLV